MMLSKLRNRLDLNLVLVVLLSVFAMAPLTYPGFLQTHSGFVSVFNLYDLERGLWSAWAWVPQVAGPWRVLTGEGRLPYLLAESLRWLGLGGEEAVRGTYILGFVASGLGMYLLAKKLFGPSGGVLAALVYVYLPFHLAAVYVRGAFAEAWAFALYPFVLLCLLQYVERRNPLWAGVAVLAYVALASTHLGLAFLYALLVILFLLVLGPSRRAKGEAVLLLVAGLVLALLLNLPAFVGQGLVGPGVADFADHFVYPFQLLSTSWGYGVSVPGWADGLPLQLGLAAVGLTVVTGLLALDRRSAPHHARRRALLFFSAAVVTTLIVTHPASVLWGISGLSWALDYPWQLLALTGVTMSLASGALLLLAPPLRRLPWQAVLVTLVILESYGYLSPRFTDLRVGGAPVGVFGDEVMLVAYEREGPLRHGATVRLTLEWQGLRPMETDYTVFVHIVDEEGTMRAQRDGMPVAGERPTSSWELAEIVSDEHEMMIPLDGPREGYVVEVGLYDAETGDRLPLTGGATAVILQ
jgi:asparagine N-glycosylation enzyme membrane subunit Stt3